MNVNTRVARHRSPRPCPSRAPLCSAVALAFLSAACSAGPVDPRRAPSDPAPSDAPHIERSKTPFAFTPFPADTTAADVERANVIVRDFSDLYALHFEPGIPWAEALADKPFPASFQSKWDDFARRKPAGKKVYIVLEPLDMDRKELAPPAQGSSLPAEMKGAPLDSEVVERAYLNFARRAVRQFHPDFINIGLEAGELAGRHPDRWPQFVALFQHVQTALKRDDPGLKIGISFGLQMLMRDDVASRSKPLVDSSDYLGLSFYPYMSAFHVKFHADPLPPPPDEWRTALEWARNYTKKPIAICETGYTTRDIDLSAYKLKMHGDADLQRRYLIDLAEYARRDDYLFVVWYLATDYDRMYEHLPPGDGSNLLWRNIGLFDGERRPKPAWDVWKAIVGRSDAADLAGDGASAPGDRSDSAPAPGRVSIGFHSSEDLFGAPPTGALALDDGIAPGERAMRWSFEYKSGEMQWCAKDLKAGALAGKRRMSVSFKSDAEGPILVELEESNSQGFYAVLQPTAEWQEKTFELSALSLDKQKKKDGKLDAKRVTKILIADAGATTGSKGGRKLWFSKWYFE